jgi:acyl-CoA thioesterase-1
LALACACGAWWIACVFTGAAAVADERRAVVFLGDSLTAGYGLTADQAYPARVQQRIDDAGLRFRVVNAGVSGDTMAGGLRRVEWLLKQPIAVLVVALGANDMLRGQSVDALRSNLRGILDKLLEAEPEARIVIAGMRAAPNLGRGYGRKFEQSYAEIAREYDAVLIPFVLEGVAGDPTLNQADGIHPTAKGQERVAETVWAAVAPVLRTIDSP